MLRRKLYLVFKQRFAKHFSATPLPKLENQLPPQDNQITFKENEILQYPDYFNVQNLFTVKDLFNARVHFGHKTSSLHCNMKPFVFGSRLNHVIFDLDVTAYFLREALNFTAHIAYREGIILFVSKNPRATLLVEQTALECKEYAVTRDWRMGTFTDSQMKFGTAVRLPDLCILLNTLEENGHEHQSVVESAKMCIPTVGIVDSNCNPNLITYPVPGNDDSFSCCELYCKLFKQAILRGKSEREKDMKKNVEAVEKNTETVGNDKTITKVSNDIKHNETDEITKSNGVCQEKN